MHQAKLTGRRRQSRLWGKKALALCNSPHKNDEDEEAAGGRRRRRRRRWRLPTLPLTWTSVCVCVTTSLLSQLLRTQSLHSLFRTSNRSSRPFVLCRCVSVYEWQELERGGGGCRSRELVTRCGSLHVKAGASASLEVSLHSTVPAGFRHIFHRSFPRPGERVSSASLVCQTVHPFSPFSPFFSPLLQW